MALEFAATTGGNMYPVNGSDYDQSEYWRLVAQNRDQLDTATVTKAVNKIIGDVRVVVGGKRVPDGSDLNLWRGYEHRGEWYIESAAHAALITGLPAGAGVGNFKVLAGPPGHAWTTHLYYQAGPSARVMWRTMNTGNTFTEWAGFGSGGGGDAVDPYEPVAVGMKNADLMDIMIQRKGGSIGTGGKAAFALRIDHGTRAFQENLAALLKKYGLTCTMAVYSKQREVDPTDNGTAWTTVDTWHRRYGMTFGNHSDDHLDKPDAAGWHGGTIGSAEALKTLLPTTPVEQYIPHGSVGYERYGTFNEANTHEKIVGTQAGRMALASHALIAGYRGGRYRPLRGAPVQGLTHWTMESSTPSVFKSVINSAISDGMGVAVMFHPEFIGLTGKMTWADIDECLAYVAQKRDEGVLVPLTLDGLAVADSRTTFRDDLHRDPIMASAASWGGAGFTKTPGAFTSSAAGAEASFALSLANKTWALGGARVAEWHVTATAATNITVAVTDEAGTWVADRAVALTAGDHIIPNPFGIPLDHSGNLITKLVLNSGSITVKGSHLYAN